MRRAVGVGWAMTIVVGGGAVIASATPPSGASGPILSRGQVEQKVVVGEPTTTTVTRRVKVRVGGRTYTRRVRVRVPSVRPLIACKKAERCDSAFQRVTLAPGGSTGWHTHPGVTFVSVVAGEGTLYPAGAAGSECTGQKYRVGQGFSQSSEDMHTLRNEGTTTLVLDAFYLLPPGTLSTAIRTDQPQSANCPNIP